MSAYGSPGMFGGEIGGVLLAVPVTESPFVTPGQMLWLKPGHVVAGVGVLSDSEWVRREARRIVRSGLADVLAWLGESDVPSVRPTPVEFPTGWWIEGLP